MYVQLVKKSQMVYQLSWTHSLSRKGQAWDFRQDVGLIVAGGRWPDSKKVERSVDFGQSKTSLPDLPHGYPRDTYLEDACLSIVNSTTVFVAGGECTSYFLSIIELERNSFYHFQFQSDLNYIFYSQFRKTQGHVLTESGEQGVDPRTQPSHCKISAFMQRDHQLSWI